MSISRFLNYIYDMERSGLIHIDTEQLWWEKETPTISWELTHYPNFKLFYEYGEHEAILFIQEKGQLEKLLYMAFPLNENPCAQLLLLTHKLRTILQIANQATVLEG